MCSGDSCSQARAQDVTATVQSSSWARDSQVSPQAHDQGGALPTALHGRSGWEK